MARSSGNTFTAAVRHRLWHCVHQVFDVASLQQSIHKLPFRPGADHLSGSEDEGGCLVPFQTGDESRETLRSILSSGEDFVDSVYVDSVIQRS